jgi:hypothetical protein
MLSYGTAEILRFPQNDGLGDSYSTLQSVILSPAKGLASGRWRPVPPRSRTVLQTRFRNPGYEPTIPLSNQQTNKPATVNLTNQ